MIEDDIIAEAKRRAPWFWPDDAWSIDLSCAQGQQRTIAQVRKEKYAAMSAAPLNKAGSGVGRG